MSSPEQPNTAVELGPGAWIEPAALRYAFSRSGGPGGQAVNKLSTKAELRVALDAIQGLDEAARARLRDLSGQRLTQGDEIIIVASTSRSQLDNRKACLERLRALVAEALETPKPRRPTKPSRTAVERRLAEKRRTSVRKGTRRKPDPDD